MPETVYQLAKDLNVSSIDVIRQMTLWGAPARSATSPVPPVVADRLRATPTSEWAIRPVRRPRPASTADPLDAAALIFGVPRSSLEAARQPRTPGARRPAPNRKGATATVTWQTPWLRRLIDPTEIDAWIAAGLDRHQRATADTLRQYRVTPGMLATPLTGRTAAARLRAGEPVGQVIARLREAGKLSA